MITGHDWYTVYEHDGKWWMCGSGFTIEITQQEYNGFKELIKRSDIQSETKTGPATQEEKEMD